jgi:signal peptidase II
MRRSVLPFFAVSSLILVLDQVTKHLVVTYLFPSGMIPLLPFLNLVYVENVGSAFGLFKSLGNTFFVVISFAAMAAVAAIMVREASHRLSFSLVLGGAAGNLVDRLVRGYVVDFLDVYVGRFHWPSFNVADSALTVGIIVLLAGSLRGTRVRRIGADDRPAGGKPTEHAHGSRGR